MQDIFDIHDSLSSLLRRATMLNKSTEEILVEVELIVDDLKNQINDYNKYVDNLADGYDDFGSAMEIAYEDSMVVANG